MSRFYTYNYVGSITFSTNLDTYGPFGTDKSGEQFSIQCGDDFFGFHGTSDSDRLRAIGVYIKPSVSPSTTTDVPLVKPIE